MDVVDRLLPLAVLLLVVAVVMLVVFHRGSTSSAARKISSVMAAIGAIIAAIGLAARRREKDVHGISSTSVPPVPDHVAEADRIVERSSAAAEKVADEIRAASDDDVAKRAAERFDPDRPTKPR